ncbi:MAG: adenosylcobinamide-GDP ribazoletransferase [Pseudomonadota bacterium]
MAQQPSLIEARDLPAAVGLLTRLPVTVDGQWAAARGARAAWAYPLAGLLVGALVCALAAGLSGVLSPGFAAAMALAAGIIVTGALHEDGLADSADGLWGGWTRERRLEIMKDSRIGTYGVLALVLSLLLRWQGLSALIGAEAWWAIAIIPAVSRGAMVPLMALRQARPGGVSAAVGRPPAPTILLALALSALLLLPLGGAGFGVALTLAVTAAAVALIAQVKIGGQTGDILGASQQITEIAALAVAAGLLAT